MGLLPTVVVLKGVFNNSPPFNFVLKFIDVQEYKKEKFKWMM